MFLRTRGTAGETAINIWKLPFGGGAAVLVNPIPITTPFGTLVPVFSGAFDPIAASYVQGDSFFVELVCRDVSGMTDPADLTVELIPHAL